MIFGFCIMTCMCSLCPCSSKRYCWSPRRLFLVPCDTDDVDSNHLPTSQPPQRSGQMKGMCKQGLSSCNRIMPQALQLMRPKHQQRVIISTREALNFLTPRLWGRCCSTVDEVQKKGRARCRVMSPKYAEWLFSSSRVSWWMQLLHALGELINYKAGWVSKVNDLIIFPASLLRSQLSGSGKWGCGPLWRLRGAWVCVCACVCVSVKERKSKKRGRVCMCVYFIHTLACVTVFASLRLSLP